MTAILFAVSSPLIISNVTSSKNEDVLPIELKGFSIKWGFTFVLLGDFKYAITSLRCVKSWSGSGESELSNLDGASRVLIFRTSESSDENVSTNPKTEVAQGLSVPSSPISPAAAICFSEEDGMIPEEARTANAIGKSNAVEVLERSAGARFTVIALPGQRWPQAISADLILVAEALAA
jgi:hypothetical protein